MTVFSFEGYKTLLENKEKMLVSSIVRIGENGNKCIQSKVESSIVPYFNLLSAFNWAEHKIFAAKSKVIVAKFWENFLTVYIAEFDRMQSDSYIASTFPK